MISIDLHRSLEDKAWPGLRIYTRFVSLQRYRNLLDEYVPLMHDQALLRWKAELARRPPPENDAEQQEIVNDIEVQLNHDIISNFYNAYLIPLSAALESSLADLCEYVQSRESLSIRASDLREQSSVKRSLQYLQLAMRRELPGADAVKPALRDLQVVRNALAHTNGRLDEQQPNRRQELEALAKSDQWITIWDNHVIVRPAFLLRSTEAAEQMLNELLEFISITYPPVKRSSAP